MTSRQRLLSALRCQEPDRVPVHVWGVPAWNQEWVDSRDPSYGPVIEAVAEYGDYLEIWGVPAGGLLTQDFDWRLVEEREVDANWTDRVSVLDTPRGPLRSVYRLSRRGLPGMQQEYPVKTPEDVERVLSLPYIPPRPDCTRFFEMQRQIGERGLVMVGLLNPIYLVQLLLGSERLAWWSVERRDLILLLLETFTQRMEDLVRYLLGQGVGPVFHLTGAELAVPPLHSPADFRAFLVDFEPRFLRPVQEAGGLWHVHCHGSVRRVLDGFLDLGINCLHPVEAPPTGDTPLAEAKQKLRGRICIDGNIQHDDIWRLPEDRFRALVREVLEIAAPGGGFILDVTASPYEPALSPQAARNYVALVDEGARWGR